MWVIFVVLEASIILGVPTIAIIASKLADRVFVRRMRRDLDEEYRRLTAASRHDM